MSRRQIYVRAILLGWSVVGLVLATQFNACSKVGFEVSNLEGKLQANNLSTIIINNGDPYTKDSIVTLSLLSSGASEMFVSNDPNCLTGSWEPYRKNRSWSLGSLNQSVSVYAKYRSPDFGETVCLAASIVHDDILPVVHVDSAVPAISVSAVVGSTFHATDSGSGVDELLCIKPGQVSALPCAGIYSETVPADGGYRVKFIATDKAGNTSAPLEQLFTVDSTPPVLTLNSKPLATTSDTNATFQFSATDNLTGIAKYECNLENGSFVTCNSGTPYLSLALGTHRFRVRAFDGAGNVSNIADHQWEIGTNLASIHFTQTPDPLTNSAQAIFKFEGQESNGSPLTQFECRLDGSSYASCSSPTTLLGLVQGEHTFMVRGISAFGGYTAELSYTWKVDLSLPVIDITDHPDALTKENSATFVFEVTDNDGLASVTCSLDGGPALDCRSLTATYPGLAGDAEHRFVVRAEDNAGNVATEEFVWVIDNTPPTVQIVSGPQALSPDRDSTFQLGGTDLHGPVTFECRLDNSSSGFMGCPARVPYPGLADGTHKFEVRSRDAAGNYSAILEHNWTIVSAGPVINFTRTPNDGILTTESSVLSYVVTDTTGVRSVVCKIDGVVVNCANPSGDIPVPPQAAGPHTITVIAKNNLNKETTKEHRFTVRPPNCDTPPLVNVQLKTKMLFVVDMSGSNESSWSSIGTDRGKSKRHGSMQAFLNKFGPNAKFHWAFNTFQGTSSKALINSGYDQEPRFKDKVAMQTALTSFKNNLRDSGDTPYGKALDLAYKAIFDDPDRNSTVDPTQYIIVFMSDGMPDDPDRAAIMAKVRAIVGLKPERITFNAVYYGPNNADNIGYVQEMAVTHGRGNFLNTASNPNTLTFDIESLVRVPGVPVCN